MEYKVLILEDNEIDASLMERNLQRSAYDFQVEWMDNGEDFEKKVLSFEPDVIVSDYRLKGYSGLDAIRYKQVHCEDIPIIIVSGTIGEEKAVELIKKGATDFIIKNNISTRLDQAVIRAIKEAVEKENRRRAEFRLKRSEERFRMLFEHSLDGIIIGNPESGGEVITANSAACRMLGYKPKEIEGKPLDEFIKVDSKKVRKALDKQNREGGFRGQINLRQKKGTLLPVEVSSHILELKNGVTRSYYTFRDISDRIEAEQKIQHSLREKETLLTEIHHRVKNNLAVISGIMELQAMESENDELRSKLFDSQSRIKSIALTHELLYEEQNFSSIDYGANVKKLVKSIAMAMNTDVEFNFELDSLRLDINQALPCSLIVNELVTNSLRHAFDKNGQPTIDISLKDNEGVIHLVVSDNGKGLPEEIDLEKPTTIGFKLINILSKQLDAELEVSSNSGTKFHLKFNKKHKKGSSSAIIVKY